MSCSNFCPPSQFRVPSPKDIFEKHIQSLPDEVQIIIAEILKKNGRLDNLVTYPTLQADENGNLYDCQITFYLPEQYPENGRIIHGESEHKINIRMLRKN